MKPQCVICSDLFDSSSEVSATPCGHVFHQLCLMKWLHESNGSSCPQCRTKVSQRNIIMKLYFDCSEEGGSSQPDPACLQNLVSELRIKLSSSHKDRKNLEDRLAGLKEEILELEAKKTSALAEVEKKHIALTAQTLQLEYMESRLNKAEGAHRELIKLKKKLAELQNIERLLSGRPDEIQEILDNCGENSHATRTLATYCSLLKKELQATSDSKKTVQTDKMRLQDEASVFRQKLRDKSQKIAELNAKLSNVQAELELAQEEKRSLQKKILDLERIIKSPSRPSGSSLSRFLLESPAPAVLSPDNKRPKLSDPTQDTTGKENLVSEPVEPALPVNPPGQLPKFRLLVPASATAPKPGNVPDFPRHLNSFRCSSSSSATAKGNYDGMGGHSSSLDEFPKPRSVSSLQQQLQQQKRKPVGGNKTKQQRTLESFVTID